MKKKEEIELLDFTKINEKNIIKPKKNTVKKKILIILAVIIYLALALILYNFLLKDILKNEKSSVKVEIIEAYTVSKNGRNLTLYDDGTFKYMDLEIVKSGNYKVENNVYTLTYDGSSCELIKTNNILTTSCQLVMNSNDNNYMTTKNKKISKILYDVNSDVFTKISSVFLTYINGLPVTKKYPNLKASKVDSISDCFTLDNMKTFTCSFNYTVIPDETDLSKSVWLEKGTIVNGSIKKFHYVTFANTNNDYKFSKMDINL